jgi:hypothetical protein
MTDVDWNFQLAQQLDWHWREQLRPRLNGLTDEEYRWEPVPGAWNVRPRGTGTAPIAVGGGEFTMDYAMPEPDPPPVTTIAWRLGHIVVGGPRHAGGVALRRPAGRLRHAPLRRRRRDRAGAARRRLRRVDRRRPRAHAREMARAIGPAEGPWADRPMAELVLHINREMLHHGAEIALLRDLYQWHFDGKGA